MNIDTSGLTSLEELRKTLDCNGIEVKLVTARILENDERQYTEF